MKFRKIYQLMLVSAFALVGSSRGDVIAGVNFEGGEQSVFDRTPDDLNAGDGISVSSGTDGGAGLFDGWTFARTNGGSPTNGLLRNDGGANEAGATSPDFPARLEGATIGSWSIVIPEGVTLNLEKIEFDVRGGTGGRGRGGQFKTSLDPVDEYLWEDLDLPGRTTGDWQRIEVDLTDARYQGLAGQEVAFIWTTPGGAIDLDSIEVFGATGAGFSSGLVLAIVPVAETPGTFDFAWNSREGKVYDLVSSTGLDTPVDQWPVFQGDIAAAGDTTELNAVVVADLKRFFAIIERDPINN